MRRKRNEWIRLTARVTLADYTRLKDIQKKYKFKSVYQILNYLAYSFLRVADKKMIRLMNHYQMKWRRCSMI